MKKLLIVAVCLTLVSCGLFNRTVTKKKVNSSVSATVSVSASDASTSNVTATNISEGGRISSSPARSGTAKGRINNGVGVVTDSAGLLLVALIDTLSGSLTIGYSIPGGYHYDWWRDSARNVQADSSSSVRDSSDNHEEVSSATDSNKERKPNFIGTIGLWIGICLVVIAAIWAVAKFVLKR